MNDVKAKAAIDPRRVYLFGHSAGAVFGLQMGVIESKYFAAAAVHAGAIPPENYSLIGYAERKIPEWIAISTRDHDQRSRVQFLSKYALDRDPEYTEYAK